MPSLSLAELLQKQKGLAAQLLELSRQQAQLIENEDMEALLKNLDARQQIIGQADDLLPQTDALLKKYQSGPAVAEIDNLRQDISRILQEITEINHKSQTAVRERMDFFQAEIRRLSDTRKGVDAYFSGAAAFASGYFDQHQ